MNEWMQWMWELLPTLLPVFGVFVHGKGTVFKLDDSAGALVDLSPYIMSVGFSRSRDVAEVTTFGDQDKDYLAGLRDATLSLEGKWDAVLDAHMANVLGLTTGASQTFEYGPEGSAAGKVRYTGEAQLVSYDPDSPLDDAAGWSAELQVSGAITRNTF